MTECCRRYLAHSLDIIAEWSAELEARPERDFLVTCIRQQAQLCAPIARGGECPWHQTGVPEHYLAAMTERYGMPAV